MTHSDRYPLPRRRKQFWRRIPWALSLLLVGAVACSGGLPGLPAATETPVPPMNTATTEPTLTPSPVPTDTATPQPTNTATPNATATILAQAAETQAAAQAIIGPDLERYGLSAHQGALGWMHASMSLDLSEYLETQVDTDYPDLTVADFVVQADITWNSTSGLAGCGFIVRAAPGLRTNVQYELLMIRLSGAPLWSFGLFAGGDYGELIASGDAPTLNVDLGSTNTVAVVGSGGHFGFFVNSFLIGEATDDRLSQGVVAFMARQESGHTTCTFDNAWLWILRSGSGVQAQ